MFEVGPSLSLRDGGVASIDVKPTTAGEMVLLLGTYGKLFCASCCNICFYDKRFLFGSYNFRMMTVVVHDIPSTSLLIFVLLG